MPLRPLWMISQPQPQRFCLISKLSKSCGRSQPRHEVCTLKHFLRLPECDLIRPGCKARQEKQTKEKLRILEPQTCLNANATSTPVDDQTTAISEICSSPLLKFSDKLTITTPVLVASIPQGTQLRTRAHESRGIHSDPLPVAGF